MWAGVSRAKPVFDIAKKFFKTFSFKKLPQKISEIIKEMTKDRINELYGLAANGIIRPELAANVLTEVCEAALELFRIVEEQNLRLKKLEGLKHPNHDTKQKTP